MQQRLIWIFWPSFVIGGVGWGVFFALFDPQDLPFADTFIGQSRIMVYSIGFFLFWMFAAASSAFTCLLQKPASDLNRFCPLEPPERPLGCPKREDPDAACE